MKDREYPGLGDDKIVDPFWDIQEAPIQPPRNEPRRGPREARRSRRKKKIGRLILIFLIGLALGWALNALIPKSSDREGPGNYLPVRGLLFEKALLTESPSSATPVTLPPGETLVVKYGKESIRYLGIVRSRSLWSRMTSWLRRPTELYLGEQPLEPGEDLTPLLAPERELKVALLLKGAPQGPVLATSWIQLEMDPRAWLARAQQIQDAQAKRECLKKALDAYPEDVDLLMAMGKLLWKLNETRQAAQYFRRAAKLDPKNVEAMKALAVLWKKERPRDALKAYEQLVALDQDNRLDYYRKIAQLQIRVGISPEATYRKILSIRKDDPEALQGLEGLHANHLQRAKSWQKKGDLAKAIQEAKKALALRDSRDIRKYISALYNNLGFSLAKKRPKQAIRYYMAALEYEKDPATYLNLADLYYKTKKIKQALDALKSALSLKPKDPTTLKGIYILLAEIFMDQKDYDGAIKYLKEARGRLPKDPDIALALSQAYWKKGDLQSASLVLRQVSRLVSSRPKKEQAAIHRTLGDLYRLMGDREKDLKAKISQYDRALAAYERAMSLDGNDKEAQKRWDEVAGRRKALKIKLLQSS